MPLHFLSFSRRPAVAVAGFIRKTAVLIVLSAFCSAENLMADEPADSTASAVSFSLRLAGEGEYRTSGGSWLNPSNILERPDTRLEAFAIGNAYYKALGGVFETEMRFSHEYISGTSGDSFDDSFSRVGINQLYYQKKFDELSILFGRKKVRWGVGYSYSPTDLLSQLRNPEDPEDRLGRNKGADLLQVSLNTEKDQLDIAYVPDLDWDFDGQFVRNSRMAMRWYRFVEPFDLSVVGTVDEDGRWAAGFNTSVTVGKSLEMHAEYLYTSSIEKRYPDVSIDPSSFTMPYFSGCGEGYHSVVLGGQYTFENNINLTLEYLFRSDGYSDEEFRAYTDHIGYLYSEYPSVIVPDPALAGLYESASNFIFPLRKHYLFTRLYHPDVTNSISLEMYSYLSLMDGSGFFVFMPKYEKDKHYEVYLRLKKFWGSNDTEFGLVPDDFSAIIGFSLFLGS
jgi:hypothetical protein